MARKTTRLLAATLLALLWSAPAWAQHQRYPNAITLAPGTTQIDASVGTVFITANSGSTTITRIKNTRPGETVTVSFGDAHTTIDLSSNPYLQGNGGVDWSPTDTDEMRCDNIGSDVLRCTVGGMSGGGGPPGDEVSVNGTDTSDANLSSTNPAAASGATNVTFALNAATSPDNVSASMDWTQFGLFRAKAYGAVCDGTTNDQAAIQAALNAAGTAQGGIVEIPDAACAIASALTIPTATFFQGEGRRSKVIASAAMTYMAKLQVSSSRGQYGGIRDLHFDAKSNADYAVLMDSWQFADIENVEINNAKIAGFRITSDQSSDTNFFTIDHVFVRPDTTSTPIGSRFAVVTAGATGKVTDSVFRDCSVQLTHNLCGQSGMPSCAGIANAMWHLTDTARIVRERCSVSSSNSAGFSASVLIDQSEPAAVGALTFAAGTGSNIDRDGYHEQQGGCTSNSDCTGSRSPPCGSNSMCAGETKAEGVVIDATRTTSRCKNNAASCSTNGDCSGGNPCVQVTTMFNRFNAVEGFEMQAPGTSATAFHVKNTSTTPSLALANRFVNPRRTLSGAQSIIVDANADQTEIRAQGGNDTISCGATSAYTIQDLGTKTRVNGALILAGTAANTRPSANVIGSSVGVLTEDTNDERLWLHAPSGAIRQINAEKTVQTLEHWLTVDDTAGYVDFGSIPTPSRALRPEVWVDEPFTTTSGGPALISIGTPSNPAKFGYVDVSRKGERVVFGATSTGYQHKGTCATNADCDSPGTCNTGTSTCSNSGGGTARIATVNTSGSTGGAVHVVLKFERTSARPTPVSPLPACTSASSPTCAGSCPGLQNCEDIGGTCACVSPQPEDGDPSAAPEYAGGLVCTEGDGVSTPVCVHAGTDGPNGSETGNPGDFYLERGADDGDSPTAWIKASGTDANGWSPLQAGTVCDRDPHPGVFDGVEHNFPGFIPTPAVGVTRIWINSLLWYSECPPTSDRTFCIDTDGQTTDFHWTDDTPAPPSGSPVAIQWHSISGCGE